MVLPLVLAFVHRPPGGAATGGGTDDVGLLRAAIGVVTALAGMSLLWGLAWTAEIPPGYPGGQLSGPLLACFLCL